MAVENLSQIKVCFRIYWVVESTILLFLEFYTTFNKSGLNKMLAKQNNNFGDP